ncbi:trimethylamine methyltransferase [Thermacetogenium phaeum DSM 12270]|uniref:Trimethylamine methyltransferase n=1 Tax=Thermacetogenium phaeum (strain ATCC BAA-254 / DSM 26808 / PB) TaxID=1089553 RepID=K4LS46_THEPS|nr:trimethylamine methyltransferase [Thermacetogenium phaeum DSM 12270]
MARLVRRGIHAGSHRMEGIGLRMFTEDELWDIHYATLDLLWNVGVKIESEQARQIYADNGCLVDEETQIVKIPPHLVEEALVTAPKTFRACGRDPENDWICDGNRTGFVNFGEAVQLIDPETRELRKPTQKDLDDVVRICEYLDQIVVFERPLAPSEVDQDVGQVYVAESFYRNCTKHAYIGMNRPENMRAAAKMGYVVAGGEDKFRQRPLFSQSTDPVSPLVFPKGAVDTLLEAIKCGVPAKINPLGMPGGTTCVNLAGTLVTENAEKLSMFVLGQLVKKGYPMVYGSSTSAMDMKTGLAAMGAPELALYAAATAKMAQFYNLPSWVGGG